MDESTRTILRNNLAWLRHDEMHSAELYRSVLTELAHDICKGDTLPYPADAKAEFSDICPMDMRIFAQFCGILTKDVWDDTEVREILNIAYVRSAMTDKAFAAFSANDASMSASYGADFRSVCEDVYYERSDACILPLESSQDGLLMSFMKLILKYELWIHGVYRYRTEDDSFVTLALLTATPDSTGDVFELYLPSSAKATAEDICAAVSVLGGVVLRISTVSTENGDNDIHASVKLPNDKTSALRYFLDAMYPSHMILGNYYNLY